MSVARDVRGRAAGLPRADARSHGTRWARVAGRWFAAAALAGPVGVVLHEAAHALVALGAGLDGVALHFASMGYAGQDAFWEALRTGAPLPMSRHAAGLVAGGGVIATWLLAAAAAAAARRIGTGSFWGAVLGSTALLAPARGYTGLSYLLVVRPKWPGAFPNFDEFRAAAALGTPVDPWVLAGVAVMAGTWAVLTPRIGRDGWAAYPALLLGTGAGMAAWGAVGPAVLP